MDGRSNPRKKRSKIWLISDSDLRDLVAQSSDLSTVLRSIGLRAAGGNHKTLKQRLHDSNIDFSHCPMGLHSNLGKKFKSRAVPDIEVLIENSPYSRPAAKRRFMKTVENVCSICGQESIWNGMPITLILDHVNGIYNDHRTSNLRLVCPNCNSQLDTFCGRNI